MKKILLFILSIVLSLNVYSQIPVEDKFKPLGVGHFIGDAIDIETTDANVQSELNNLNSSILNWRFNGTITDASNPGLGFLALNNALKDNATIISFSVQTNTDNARYTTVLQRLKNGDLINIHERDAINNSILYEVTGNPTTDGTKINVPVARELDQGVEFTNNAVLIVRFEWTSGTASVPNAFLDEIEEVDRNVYARQETPAGQVFGVRFWLRDAEVTPSNINDPGVGLIIGESNGEFGQNDNQFRQNSNAAQSFLYVTLDDQLVANIANLFVRVFDEDGNEIGVFNMQSNFTEQSSLSGLAAGTVYLLTSGDRGGSFLHYMNNELIQLFTATNDPFFDLPAVNENDVDLTRSVKDLPESRLSTNLQIKINQQGVPFDDQFKLDQFVEATSTSTSAQLTGSTQLLYRLSEFSPDTEDYFSADFDTGIPPSIGGSTTWFIAVPHEYNLVSFTGIDGTTTVTPFKTNIRLTPSAVNNNQDIVYNTYTITVPDAVSGTPTNLTPDGTETSITELDPTSIFKINRDNVSQALLSDIENGANSSEITQLKNRVSTLYPLSTYVDRLTDWGTIYEPDHATENVEIVSGYSLLADFRATDDRYESAGVTYTAGTGVSEYTGLTDNYNRAFAFKVTAASDKVLMWIVDGVETVPFVDITAGGQIRVNDYTPSASQDVDLTNQYTGLTLAAGGVNIITTAVPKPRAIYTIPDFPANTTNQSQGVTADFEVLVNGNDLGAGGDISFSIPVTPTSQSRINSDHTFNLGPLYNNRQITVTIGHRLTFSDPDYQIDFTLQAAPSDITLRVNNVSLFRNYTTSQAVPRVDNFLSFSDALGTYTFTGEQEFILSFDHGHQGSVDAVPATVGADGVIDELNNLRIQELVTFNSIEVADDIEFRTFQSDHFLTHSDLAHLLENRAIKWVYSLARLNTVTGRAVNQPIDLASGTTIGGAAFPGLRSWTDAQTFTPGSTVTVDLPISTTIANYERCAVTWHTGVGTATDNDNRDYVSYFDWHQIVNHTRNEIIIGGRGRGADNFGIQVTKPLSTATSVTMEIINLNDAGGAVLPAGTLITDIEFY